MPKKNKKTKLDKVCDILFAGLALGACVAIIGIPYELRKIRHELRTFNCVAILGEGCK